MDDFKVIVICDETCVEELMHIFVYEVTSVVPDVPCGE